MDKKDQIPYRYKDPDMGHDLWISQPVHSLLPTDCTRLHFHCRTTTVNGAADFMVKLFASVSNHVHAPKSPEDIERQVVVEGK